MKEKEFRRNMAVFPIGSVMKLTDLSARQIRYYEDQELIKPDRNEGNRRMYSLNDWIVCLKSKIISLKVIISLPLRKNMLNVKRNPRKRLVRLRCVVHFTMNSSNRVALLQYGHLLVAVRQPQVVIH